VRLIAEVKAILANHHADGWNRHQLGL